VDLVAPEELGMPPYYIRAMESAGFNVRRFASIDEYLAQGRVAPSWYFTRLQLERMGERLLEMADKLREAVTFRRDHLPRVGDGTRFFHPLPRHQITPVIPTFLDTTPLNGWDLQSMNGYFTRIVEIAMVGGQLGLDFAGESVEPRSFVDDFVEEAEVRPKQKPDYKIGIKPVENGIVIDHIGRGKDPESIWNHIDQIRQILGLNCISSHGVYISTRTDEHKGIISLPEIEPPDERRIKMLGAIAPGCTLNVIENGRVRRKYRLHMPPRVYNLPGISCKNDACVSNPDHHEPVSPEFYRDLSETFVCRYCERPHDFKDIW
jgi:aspartate carbamoyltransferase